VERRALPTSLPKALVVELEHTVSYADAHDVAPILCIDGKDGKGGAHPKAIAYGSSSDSVMQSVLGDIGHYDEHAQPIDLRQNNSWTATIGHIHPIEMMETIMVNQFVPTMLINELLPVLSRAKEVRAFNESVGKVHRGGFARRARREIMDARRLETVSRGYVINVSAMEGRFDKMKQGTHPHTNQAKAALNMLTRTSGLQMANEHNVFMVSVDTGWVTDELPLKRRIRQRIIEKEQVTGEQMKVEDAAQNGKDEFIFHPPLDEIDGAQRCLHPIWQGLRGQPMCGVFLKDYRRISW